MKRRLRKIYGFFRRNNTLMDQCHDLKRQLQEAWTDRDTWKETCKRMNNRHKETVDYYINRVEEVTRERYQERELRLRAEDMALDSYLDNEEE